MSKHTPGHWEIAPYNGENIRFIVTEENCLVADCWPSVDPYYRNANDKRYKSPRKPNEANARLIAAAPDLLEALEFMLSVFNETYPDVADDEEDREAWAKARAAIRKATSENEQ
jgi:hypothetical protein